MLTIALTAVAQTTRQLKVYQKTGMVDVVRMNANGSIRHSCTDLNGQVHQDYVTMVVTDVEGHERQYLLTQLDSLVLPSGQRVVFNGSMLSQPLYAPRSTEWTEHPRSAPRRTSFGGSFPGKGTGNVTFYWTENDHIRLDVGDESRAVNLTNNNTNAEFVFEDSEFESPSYMVYYPDKRVTIPTVQSQTKANNSDHIGPSGDCGVAIATREGDSYSFTLTHKAAYLCFLPHIDHLPSARIEKITLNCTSAIAGTYQLSESGLYNATQTSNTITLNLTPQRDIDFFIGHDVSSEQDTCAAYMVIAPQSGEQTFTATYYITDTLSHIEKIYRQTFSFQPVANTVYPVTCHILDEEFRTIDLGLSCNWSNVNVNAPEPSKKGSTFINDEAANQALLSQTVVTQWLMPDEDQREEILEKCQWTWGEYNGQTGYLVTGAAVSKEYGKKLRIFIPCAEGRTPAACLQDNYRPVETLMVDLGLSSGTKWAARNIGATSVEDYGNYYAWGEVETKDSYTSSNYKYGTQNLGNNFDISGTQNDAAVVSWGGVWRMPTYAEMKELSDSCSWTSSTINGVKGFIVKKKTGGTGNRIFLPAAGFMKNSSLIYGNSNGSYFTSVEAGNNSSCAYTLSWKSGSRELNNSTSWFFDSGHGDNVYRYIGRPIRAVAAPNAVAPDGTILNIQTDSASWKLGCIEATLYGTLSSTMPFKGSVKVGFVVGDSSNIERGAPEVRFDLSENVTVGGRFSQTLAVYDNIGYWFRAYVGYEREPGDTVFYYGKARHYGYEMVDLGLSVKWANMNLGADSPEDYGYYYAWGELEEKDEYTWSTYKYGSTQNLGDNFNISGTENDVAHVLMGNVWRMPSNIELKELWDSCSWVWTSQNNVNGYKVTSKVVGYTNKSIFMPAAGFKYEHTLRATNSWGSYPSAVQTGNNSNKIYTVCFYDASKKEFRTSESWFFDDFYGEDVFRYVGRPIRAVASLYQPASDGLVLDIRTDSCTWRLGDKLATLHGTVSSTMPFTRVVTAGFIIGHNDSIVMANAYKTYPQEITQAGTISQTLPVHDNMGYWYRAYVVTADGVVYGKARHYGREAVDLGLPSGRLWANMNVGASSPEDYGGYYAWGEIDEKDVYNWSSYRFGSTQNLGTDRNISGTEHDAAHKNMGNAWRMPTNTELKELWDNCSWKWTSQNNVNGYLVKGPNGNTIFLPAAGFKYESTYRSPNSWGSYPCSVETGNNSNKIYTVCFYGASKKEYRTSESWFFDDFYGEDVLRYVGRTIRAVFDPNAIVADTLVMSILTDSASWKLGDSSATLYGTISSVIPLPIGTRVGFVVGDNANITKANATVYTLATTDYGSFSQQITGLQNNMGYWYRAFVVTSGGEIAYGKARHFGWEMVDLGLDSGTLWCNMNVGASNPEGSGNYFAWGETTPKGNYVPSTYAYGTSALGVSGNIQGTSYDAAWINMGSVWCMPTYTQLLELRNNCTWTWATENDVNGYRVSGTKEGYTNRSIFLPAAGVMFGEWKAYPNTYGSYYSSSLNTGSAEFVYTLGWSNGSALGIYSDYNWSPFGESRAYAAQRYYGRTVRAVGVQHVQRE